MRRRKKRGSIRWLPLAVRAYVPARRASRRRTLPGPDDLEIVLDFETLVDETQALTFGSAIVRRGGRLVFECLVHADELPRRDLRVLQRYVASHGDDRGGEIRLFNRSQFVERVLWRVGYVARARIVGFNLPFDLSRLALDVRPTPARNGGFTFLLFESVDSHGGHWRNLWRPELVIRSDGSKRAFLHFTTPAKSDSDLRVGRKGYGGRFVDLRTLAYALTDRGFTLDGAAAEFLVRERKADARHTGRITTGYIDYNRQDVRTTAALYDALREEWRRHPIDLAVEQGFSPAAVAKGYFRAGGITSPLSRPSHLTIADLGHSMVAYSGGRAEVRIRRTPVPVRYVDFSSMYPTVVALMDLWRWIIAGRFGRRDTTTGVVDLLEHLSLEYLYDPSIWPSLAMTFCRIRPHGDLLPTRAPFATDDDRPGDGAWTIGLTHLTSDELWYTLADLVAAKLLGGTIPCVMEAIAIEPIGILQGLAPVRLRGSLVVDPRRQNLFRGAIEERHRAQKDGQLAAEDRERASGFLKTFANGGSYGVFAEYHPLQPVAGGTIVNAAGLWPIRARVTTPEEPGEFCFPPLAATVTAGARLLLAVAEGAVEGLGGTYAACDTDSLVIVSSRDGGLVQCKGGCERLPDGTEAVRALSWAEVDAVRSRLNGLNPYAPGTVTDLLKLEGENFGVDGEPAELFVAAISAKRFALYRRLRDEIEIVKASTHGLGLYRRPTPDPPGWSPSWPFWVDEVWQRIIRELEGLPARPEPAWFESPAVGQLPISTHHTLRPFREDDGTPYAARVKPFNFLLVGHVDPLVGLPKGVAPGLVPVGPFTSDLSKLLDLPWRSKDTGHAIAVTTRTDGESGKVRLRTYRDVIADYRFHPESKSGHPGGGPGQRGSVGLLPRLHVVASGVPRHIGKESNRLEEVEQGLVAGSEDAYVEYRDARREWEAIVPRLLAIGIPELAKQTGMSTRTLRSRLNTGRLPRQPDRDRLIEMARSQHPDQG